MEVIAEGNLDKEAMVPDQATVTKQLQKTIYYVIHNDYFDQTDLVLPKYLHENKKLFNKLQFIPVEAKNKSNRLVLSFQQYIFCITTFYIITTT